jgi:hypothetical protein
MMGQVCRMYFATEPTCTCSWSFLGRWWSRQCLVQRLGADSVVCAYFLKMEIKVTVIYMIYDFLRCSVLLLAFVQNFRRAVTKDGPNKGRQFHCCSKPREDQCGFFEWVDENTAGLYGRLKMFISTT